MTKFLPYDPKKNLKEGVIGLLLYHTRNPARLLSYTSLILAFSFGYYMFDFFFKTVESVIFSYFISVLTIAIPAMVVLSITARKKIKSLDSQKKKQVYAWIYSILISLIVWAEIVFFNIDWLYIGTHAFDLKLNQQSTTFVSLGIAIGIFWLPISEVLAFHLKEIRTWICARDEYLTQVEIQLGYR
ncbi:MAG: hypothetical protein ACRD38_03405 [Nitrososphaerales archaeon]